MENREQINTSHIGLGLFTADILRQCCWTLCTYDNRTLHDLKQMTEQPSGRPLAPTGVLNVPISTVVVSFNHDSKHQFQAGPFKN